MLLSVIMLCVPPIEAAIVNGDFETDLVAGNPATSPLTAWSPTNALYGTNSQFGTTVLGIDPAFYNSTFGSLVSAGGGTPGGSISAVFTTAPAGRNIISMGSISQNVVTTPGYLYDIRLWVANLPTGNSNQPDLGARENLFSVSWNGAPIDLSLWNANFATPVPSNPNETELPGPAGTYVLKATGGWTLLLITNQAASAGATTNLTISAQNNNSATAVDAVDVVPEPSSIALLAAGAALAGLRRRRERKAA